jgi:hypothetical protein
MAVLDRSDAAEVFESMANFAPPLRLANAVVVGGAPIASAFQPLLIRPTAELPLFAEDAFAIIPPLNSTESVAKAKEETYALAHPEVIAAIDAAMPDIEAWEKTL